MFKEIGSRMSLKSNCIHDLQTSRHTLYHHASITWFKLFRQRTFLVFLVPPVISFSFSLIPIIGNVFFLALQVLKHGRLNKPTSRKQQILLQKSTSRKICAQQGFPSWKKKLHSRFTVDDFNENCIRTDFGHREKEWNRLRKLSLVINSELYCMTLHSGRGLDHKTLRTPF